MIPDMDREGKNAAPGRLKLGVSACLLGEKVRYDGGHKLNHYLTKTLGPFVDWVPVCPETEIGLGIPREAMRLAGTAESPRLITRETHVDHTNRMRKWAAGRIRGLAGEELCGFIFKSRSPSCGTRRVPVVKENGKTGCCGAGIWARAFMDANPLLPVEDEDRLRDAGIRENFIKSILVYHHWRQLLADKPAAGRPADSHSGHTNT